MFYLVENHHVQTADSRSSSLSSGQAFHLGSGMSPLAFAQAQRLGIEQILGQRQQQGNAWASTSCLPEGSELSSAPILRAIETVLTRAVEGGGPSKVIASLRTVIAAYGAAGAGSIAAPRFVEMYYRY